MSKNHLSVQVPQWAEEEKGKLELAGFEPYFGLEHECPSQLVRILFVLLGPPECFFDDDDNYLPKCTAFKNAKGKYTKSLGRLDSSLHEYSLDDFFLADAFPNVKWKKQLDKTVERDAWLAQVQATEDEKQWWIQNLQKLVKTIQPNQVVFFGALAQWLAQVTFGENERFLDETKKITNLYELKIWWKLEKKAAKGGKHGWKKDEFVLASETMSDDAKREFVVHFYGHPSAPKGKPPYGDFYHDVLAK